MGVAVAARRDHRRRLGHLWPRLHIRDTAERTCHTARHRGLGEAVSVVGALGRVSMRLHRAGRHLLLGKGIRSARGTEGRGRRLSVRRRSRPAGGDARGSEVVGRDLLEGGRLRRSGWVRARRRVGGGRGIRARRGLLQAVVHRHVPSRRWVCLAVVAKGLVRVRLHRR